MGVPLRYIVHQRRVLAAMGRAALRMATSKVRGGASELPEVPTAPLTGQVSSLPQELMEDAVTWAGGDPAAWGETVPLWLHPQWGFPLLILTLEGLPYPLGRALNAGCRITRHAPIPVGESLDVRAWLEEIDDDGRRVIIHQKLWTGTASAPDALEVDFQVLVPLPREKGEGGERKKREPALVPDEAREISRWENGPRDGLEFALLTGDFNPIHWIPPAAKLSGFPNTILHGFGTMARAAEGLIHHELGGESERLASLGARFTRPVVLPREVGLYITDDGGLFVGDGPGDVAYLVGDFQADPSTGDKDNG